MEPKGTANVSGSSISGENGDWSFDRRNRQQGHQQEQHDLIEALMQGKTYNEGYYGAMSTFCAILGREACYSGKVIKWDELLEKGTLSSLRGLTTIPWRRHRQSFPGDDGKYPVPVPGQHNPFA